jgi:hypothetical protein
MCGIVSVRWPIRKPSSSRVASARRDAVCGHETDSQTRPASATGPERRQRRSIAYCNRAEPEAARQTSLPCPATSGSDLPSIGAQNGHRSRNKGERKQGAWLKLTTKLCDRNPTSFATQSIRKRTSVDSYKSMDFVLLCSIRVEGTIAKPSQRVRQLFKRS